MYLYSIRIVQGNNSLWYALYCTLYCTVMCTLYCTLYCTVPYTILYTDAKVAGLAGLIPKEHFSSCLQYIVADHFTLHFTVQCTLYCTLYCKLYCRLYCTHRCRLYCTGYSTPYRVYSAADSITSVPAILMWHSFISRDWLWCTLYTVHCTLCGGLKCTL